jgi:hypothetical protein
MVPAAMEQPTRVERAQARTRDLMGGNHRHVVADRRVEAVTDNSLR